MSDDKFCILAESKKANGEVLAYIKSPFRNNFWTNKIGSAKVCTQKEATTIISRLKHNNPRIVTLKEATEILKGQAAIIACHS